MSDTASAALQAHIAQRVTTLVWCLRITRLDGERFHFTSHDADLVRDIDDEDGAQLYSPNNSFNSFSLSFSADLSVDGSEVIAILDESGVDETEILRGLFDYAEWQMFITNWAGTISSNYIKKGRGRLGEVTFRADGTIKMELRGLIQLLRQRSIVKAIRLEDSTDLGDDKNKVPIWPDEVERLTTYACDDYVRATDGSFRNTTPLVGTNLDFDTGDLTGWTTNTGTPQVVTSKDGVTPHSGTHFLTGANANADYEVQQDIDLVSTVGLDATKIDAGEYLFSWSVRCAQTLGSGSNDIVDVRLQWLDGDSVPGVISTFFSEQGNLGFEDAWAKIDQLSEAVPATARFLRIILAGQEDSVTSSAMTVCYDSIEGEFSDISGDGPREAYLPLENPTCGWSGINTTNSVRKWTVTAGPWQADNFHDALEAVYEPMFLKASGGGGGDRSLTQTAAIPTTAIPISEIDSGDVNLVFPAAVVNHVPSDPDTYRLVIEALDDNDNLVQVLRDTGDTGFTVYDEWLDISLNTPLPADTRKIRVTWEVEGFNVFVNNGYPYLVRRTASIFTADNYDDRIYRVTVAGTTSAVKPTYDTTVGNTTVDGGVTFVAEEAWTRAVIVSSVDGSAPRRIFRVTELDPGSAGSFSPHRGFPDDWFNYGGFTFETGNNADKTIEVKNFIATDSGGEQTIELYLEAPFDVEVGVKGRIFPGFNKTREQARDKFENFIVRATPTSGLRFFGFPDLPGEGFLNRTPDFKPGSSKVDLP